MTLDSADNLSAHENENWRRVVTKVLGGQAHRCDNIDRFVEALFQQHHSAVRCRFGHPPDRLPFAIDPVPWYSLGFRNRVDEHGTSPRPSRTLEYACGDYFLQDSGSMLALAACDADQPSRGRLICDLCAAPGGKASALLESIGDGFLLANEPIRSRLAPLSFNLARTGQDRFAISNLDPDRLAQQLPGIFDLVLVDAPCSGQALLGKGKQSLSAFSENQIDHSAARAKRILSAALELLRPGGQLVFSTCTFAEAENEDQVNWLSEQDGVTGAPIERLAAWSDGACSYRVWPDQHECAGSFAASLTVNREPSHLPQKRKSKRRSHTIKELEQWYSQQPTRILERGPLAWGWPDDAPWWVESIAAAGPEIAYRTGQTWKPSHQAALRRVKGWKTESELDVDEQTAKQFLSGMPIACKTKGWHVVRFQGRPLGWVKSSGGTGKNHLPSTSRLDVS